MYCFIINRNTNNAQVLKVWETVELLLKQRKISYRSAFPEDKEETAAIVQSFLFENAQPVIVGIGGDGTMQSIIQVMVEMGTDFPLGLIPAGTGNDLANALGIPLDPEKALDCLLRKNIRSIDIGCSGNYYFATVLGVGFDGQVVQTVSQPWYKRFTRLASKLNFGKIAYIAGFFDVLLRYRLSRVHIRLDERLLEFENVWLVAVANGSTYGGGMYVCPQADLADGHFDICVIHGITRWQMLRLFFRVIRGEHVGHSSVAMLQGNVVQIDCESKMLAYGDGEPFGETPIRVKIIENALRVLV